MPNTPRTPQEIIAFYDSVGRPPYSIAENIEAHRDLPAMARRVMELEKELSLFSYDHLRCERDKLAAEVERLKGILDPLAEERGKLATQVEVLRHTGELADVAIMGKSAAEHRLVAVIDECDALRTKLSEAEEAIAGLLGRLNPNTPSLWPEIDRARKLLTEGKDG